MILVICSVPEELKLRKDYCSLQERQEKRPAAYRKRMKAEKKDEEE